MSPGIELGTKEHLNLEDGPLTITTEILGGDITIEFLHQIPVAVLKKYSSRMHTCIIMQLCLC